MFDLVYPADPAPVFPRPSMTRPGPALRAAGEMLPLVETSGQVYGQASREACHDGSHLPHPVVHLHIIDREGRIYLQKRSLAKQLYPGLWDTAVGGHVTYGETALEALYREAAEELGLQAFFPVLLETYSFENQEESELVFVYAIVGHPALDPDNAEVSEGRWWTLEELEAAFGKGLLTPMFESEFPRFRQRLLSLL